MPNALRLALHQWRGQHLTHSGTLAQALEREIPGRSPDLRFYRASMPELGIVSWCSH